MNQQQPLIPRPPRRMHQPRKDLLRDAVAALTEENIRLRLEVERLRTPWWRMAWKKLR